MGRSSKKGPYINERLQSKILNLAPGDKSVIKTWDRGATITPEMVGYHLGVHDGRKHIDVLIIEEMVGHKLGEFAATRKFVRHGGKIARDQASSQPAAPKGGK